MGWGGVVALIGEVHLSVGVEGGEAVGEESLEDCADSLQSLVSLFSVEGGGSVILAWCWCST